MKNLLADLMASKLTGAGALVGVVVWLVVVIGCAEVASPRTGERVNRDQLNAEVLEVEADLDTRQRSIDNLQAELNADADHQATVYGVAFDAMDRAEETQAAFLGFGQTMLTGWLTGNPAGTLEIVGGLVSLLGIGAAGGAATRATVKGGGVIRDKLAKRNQDPPPAA